MFPTEVTELTHLFYAKPQRFKPNLNQIKHWACDTALLHLSPVCCHGHVVFGSVIYAVQGVSICSAVLVWGCVEWYTDVDSLGKTTFNVEGKGNYIENVRFPFTRRSFIKATDISPLMFEVRTQTFTTRQTTAGVDHKSPRSCAECLSAHYTVGRSDLQAPYCLTWRSYATAASQQVKRGPIQHLIKSAASIKTSTLSGSKGHTPNLNYSIKLPEFFSVRQTVTLNSRRRLNKWTHILQRI